MLFTTKRLLNTCVIAVCYIYLVRLSHLRIRPRRCSHRSYELATIQHETAQFLPMRFATLTLWEYVFCVSAYLLVVYGCTKSPQTDMNRPTLLPIRSRQRNGGDDEGKSGAPEDDGTQAGEGPDTVRARLATACRRDFHRFSGSWNQVHRS